ncbi:hypothetical protein [Amycolatopsis solani]|uniref:hypothetical protein n=1 Tax=Amycolatopsis solani TaxID=3028615 RepID=UPI0025AF0C9A|nr:hypothetical protein [Amycolatopsis sp. MEP2-6]
MIGNGNHFAAGDRVLVFEELDPAKGTRRVRRGTVHEPPSPGVVKVDLEGEGLREFSPADPVQLSHAAGACRCVVAIG